jgi:hypothetical protein
MSKIEVKDLLDAGVHFGHLTPGSDEETLQAIKLERSPSLEIDAMKSIEENMLWARKVMDNSPRTLSPSLRVIPSSRALMCTKTSSPASVVMKPNPFDSLKNFTLPFII